MKPTPTDRGVAYISPEKDGSKRVSVCASVKDGEPENVYAVHFRRSSVKVAPDVRMLRSGVGSWSDGLVEVSADRRGTVYVRGFSDSPDLREVM